MLYVYKYFIGYVKVLVVGETPERFINYCLLNGITIWNIKRGKAGLFVCLSISDYRNIRNIRKVIDKKLQIKLIKKYGAPFLWFKVFKRPGVIIGLILLLLINFIFSQFIWSIDIVSKEQINKSEIISACKKYGINIGVPKSSIDTYNLSQLLVLNLENIAWLSVNIEGTKLTINTTLATEGDNNVKQPSNLIASVDGVIKYAQIKNGIRQFEIGQAVKKGDVLVSGTITNENSTKYVNSGGKVIAETHRSFEVKVPKKFNLEQGTARFETRSVLKLFWLEIPLYLNGVNGYSSSYANEHSLRLFGSELPIKIMKRNFIITQQAVKELSLKDAENIAISQVINTIRKFPIESVTDFSVAMSEDKSLYYATVKTKCLEDISKEQIIKTDY